MVHSHYCTQYAALYLFNVGLSYCSELLTEKGQILFLPAHCVARGLVGWNSVASGTGVLGIPLE